MLTQCQLLVYPILRLFGLFQPHLVSWAHAMSIDVLFSTSANFFPVMVSTFQLGIVMRISIRIFSHDTLSPR